MKGATGFPRELSIDPQLACEAQLRDVLDFTDDGGAYAVRDDGSATEDRTEPTLTGARTRKRISSRATPRNCVA